MIRRIVIWPDAVLSKVCEPVTDFGPALADLANDLEQTMLAARGAGLAAPQIGFSLRAICILVQPPEGGPRTSLFLANPRVVSHEGSVLRREGCLSLPGYFDEVRRPETVKVEAQDVKGARLELEGGGMLARALLHEIEHLDGRVFVGRLSGLKQRVARARFAKAKARGLSYPADFEPTLPAST